MVKLDDLGKTKVLPEGMAPIDSERMIPPNDPLGPELLDFDEPFSFEECLPLLACDFFAPEEGPPVEARRAIGKVPIAPVGRIVSGEVELPKPP